MVVEVLIKWQRRYRFEGTYRNEGHTKGTKILGSVPFLYIQEKKNELYFILFSIYIIFAIETLKHAPMKTKKNNLLLDISE